jgi:hypothetical protein
MFREIHPMYIDFLRKLVVHIDALKGSGRVDERILGNIYPNDFPASLARVAVNELVSFGYLRRVVDSSSIIQSSGSDKTYYELTHEGALAVHLDKFSVSSSNSNITDGDVIWEPLAIERDTVELNAALTSLDELAERVRGDNGFAQSSPERYASINWSLSTGIDALRRLSPSRQQIAALISAPVKWLAEKFAGAAIGELAKRAGAALADWLSFSR